MISPLSFLTVVLPMAASLQPISPEFARSSLVESSRRRQSPILLKSSRGGLSWEERSTQRRERVQKMQTIKQRFASGKELDDLRMDIKNLKENLSWAEAMRDEDRTRELSRAIRAGEKRDPECSYAMALEQVKEARGSTKLDRDDEVEKWSIEAAAARSCLPRFSLEGLWIGNYGEPGFEMINVTYSGDTLIAKKVTGDQNVPRGEISFTADLSFRNNSRDELPAIELSPEDAAKWGLDKLIRYPGKGTMAKAGFVDAKDVEGQLILFENHFSFVWVPSRHHVFFGRPSAEVSIRMLRDIISEEDEVDNMRAHAKRCLDLDMTTSIARQHVNGDIEPFKRIKKQDELKKLDDEKSKAMEGEKDKTNTFYGYFDFRKWMSTLDDAFGK